MSSKPLRRRHSSLADCDIVKKGALHVKRPPTNLKIRLKTWQKRYFVLRDDSYDRGCRLEMYPSEKNWNDSKKTGRLVIDLRQVTYIEEYRESRSFSCALTLTRRGQSPLVLGTETESELREWVVAIQLLVCKSLSKARLKKAAESPRIGLLPLSLSFSVNDSFTTRSRRESFRSTSSRSGTPGYCCSRDHSTSSSCPPTPGKERKIWSYNVEAQPTSAAKRNGIVGDYQMRIVFDSVIVTRPDGVTEAIRWNMTHIRNFKSDDIEEDKTQQMITLEASVHCGRREGTFLFRTTSGRELVARVREAVRALSTRTVSKLQSRYSKEKLCRSLSMAQRAESEPTLEVRRSPSPPWAGGPCGAEPWAGSSGSPLRDHWPSPDTPPAEMAPSPHELEPFGRIQECLDLSDSSDLFDLDPPPADDAPPPYLIVLSDRDTEPLATSTPLDERDSPRYHDHVSFGGKGPSQNGRERWKMRRTDSGYSESSGEISTNSVGEVQRGHGGVVGAHPQRSLSADDCARRTGSPPAPPPRPRSTLTTRSVPVVPARSALPPALPPLPPRDT